MKTLKNIFLLMLIASVATVMSCGGNSEPGPSDEDRFVGTWTASSVTLDEFDVTTPEYAEFSITFNDDGSYITIDGDPIFTDTGGFWTVTSSSDESTLRLTLDGAEMVANFGDDDTTLTISFTANDSVIGARIEGLVGQYVFTLNKQ